MLVAPHAAAGAAVGILIGDIAIAAPVAVMSHFVLDTVPHWQETLAPYTPTRATYIRIPLDIAIAVGIVALAVTVRPSHAIVIIISALCATAADLDVLTVVFPKLKRGIVRKYWDWHCAIQRETSSFWGLLPQFIVIALALTAIYRG